MVFMQQAMTSVNKFRWNGEVWDIRSWSGNRDASGNPVGAGILIRTNGYTWLCSLYQGVVYGSYMVIYLNGDKVAATCNSGGQLHGSRMYFHANGAIDLSYYINSQMKSDEKGTLLLLKLP
jgi:hypothetical protein